jgi:hypothetical protein
MRNVLLRGNSQRYSTYWTTLGEPTEHGKALIQHRGAQTIQIKGADSFFTRLSQDVLSARALKRPHPISVEMARTTLKRLLVDESRRIELHDLVTREAERTYQEIISSDSSIEKTADLKNGMRKRARFYEGTTEIIQNLFIVGSYWAKPHQTEPWIKAMNRLLRFRELQPAFQVWGNMQQYPALLFLYETGISAISSLNFALLKDLLTKVYFQDRREERYPLLERINNWMIFDKNEAQNLHDPIQTYQTPLPHQTQ